jgi:hypothetical protein
MDKGDIPNGIADDASPTPPHELFRATFRDASYYSTGRNWSDYAPAYRYGHAAAERHSGQRFEDVEGALEQQWKAAAAASRLVWTEARGAVQDAWNAARDEAGPA